MSEPEFELLDELYFCPALFLTLKENLEMGGRKNSSDALNSLYDQGLIKAYESPRHGR